MFRTIARLVLATLSLAGCRSQETRNLQLLETRANQLKHLSQYSSSWCELQVTLTEPAKARFQQLFPQENKVVQNALPYTWKAGRLRCEVTPLDDSPVTLAEKDFLEIALCSLLQSHYVRSPFDGLTLLPSQVIDHKDTVQLRLQDQNEYGLFLSKRVFELRLKTRLKGELISRYAETPLGFAPENLQHLTRGTRVEVDEIQYAAEPLWQKGRPELESFVILVGGETVVRHAQVKVSGCRGF